LSPTYVLEKVRPIVPNFSRKKSLQKEVILELAARRNQSLSADNKPIAPSLNQSSVTELNQTATAPPVMKPFFKGKVRISLKLASDSRDYFI